MAYFRSGKKKKGVAALSAKSETERAEIYRSWLLDYLGRMRTQREARDFLRQNECEENMIEELIAFAQEYHFLDDLNYARCFIRDGARMKHHSMTRIRYDLAQKGIERDLIDEAAALEESMDAENALYWVEKRLGGRTDEEQLQRCRAYLLSHGFSYDDVLQAIDKYLQSV